MFLDDEWNLNSAFLPVFNQDFIDFTLHVMEYNRHQSLTIESNSMHVWSEKYVIEKRPNIISYFFCGNTNINVNSFCWFEITDFVFIRKPRNQRLAIIARPKFLIF